MSDTGRRLQRIRAELSGNEALLEMLETEAAAEVLHWGAALVAAAVEDARSLDDAEWELEYGPRIRAVRQVLRAAGNWAAGKYITPEDRLRLREKFLQHFKMIFGSGAHLPPPDALDELLKRADDQTLTPRQLILQLRAILESYRYGDSHAKETKAEE